MVAVPLEDRPGNRHSHTFSTRTPTTWEIVLAERERERRKSRDRHHHTDDAEAFSRLLADRLRPDILLADSLVASKVQRIVLKLRVLPQGVTRADLQRGQVLRLILSRYNEFLNLLDNPANILVGLW